MYFKQLRKKCLILSSHNGDHSVAIVIHTKIRMIVRSSLNARGLLSPMSVQSIAQICWDARYHGGLNLRHGWRCVTHREDRRDGPPRAPFRSRLLSICTENWIPISLRVFITLNHRYRDRARSVDSWRDSFVATQSFSRYFDRIKRRIRL